MRQAMDNSENMPPMITDEDSKPLLGQNAGVDALPKKTGPVCMAQVIGGRQRKAHVVLSVYSNSYGSYAVVSQDKVLCKDFGYINLRNCTVQKSDNTLQIHRQDGEGQPLSFTVKEPKELDAWLNTLTAIEEAIMNPEQEEGHSIPKQKVIKRRPLGQLPQRCPSIRRKPVMPALTEECSEE